jgi:phosphonate transport system substrate-binding protein
MNLRITSIQAPNADPVCRQIGAYLSTCLEMPVEFVDDIPWEQRELLLDQGEIQAGWICGLPYVRKADRPQPTVELLAAPVMRAARYGNQPVYFSDVIVREDSRFQSFAKLRGASWAYNEPNSQSGYNITRYYLATLGERDGFFGRVVQAGSHQASLQMVLEGDIDASAIDSTVLETEFMDHPEIRHRLRILSALGPSPIPPWVTHTRLLPGLRDRIRGAFLDMEHDPAGQRVLDAGQLRRFVAVSDRDYDPIRAMARLAEGVRLEK